jgi:hypothetical protein
VMKLPCCLVNGGAQLFGRQPPEVAKRRHHQHKQKCTKTTTNWVGLALLLTSLVSDPNQNDRVPHHAVSTSISTLSSPSALYELASFMALEENAEEQKRIATLNDRRGSSHHAQLKHHPPSELVNIRIAGPSTSSSVATSGAASPHRILRPQVTIRDTLNGGGSLARPVFVRQQAATATTTSSACSSAQSSPSVTFSDPNANHDLSSSATTVSNCDSPTEHPLSSNVPTASSGATRVDTVVDTWKQVHVLALANEIGHKAFTDTTAGLLARGLFPIVYRCFVDDIHVGQPLRDTTPGNQAVAWRCGFCGKMHHSVREACIRCHAPCANVSKLFIGQVRKELPCDDLLDKIIFAASMGEGHCPTITPLRVEGHTLDHGRRGKGCGSVYCSRMEGVRLTHLLHRNMFLDTDWATGREVLFFAYSEQRVWMEQFAAARIMTAGPNRPSYLPNKLLVCEFAAGDSGDGWNATRLATHGASAW